MKSLAMIAVVGLILLAYGAIHYYTYSKLLPVFPWGRWSLAVALGILGGSIFIVMAMANSGTVHGLARSLAFAAFSWMGIVFLFFCFSLFVDVVAKLASLPSWPGLSTALASPLRSIVVAALAVAVGFWGYVAAQDFSVLTTTLTSPRLISPVRVVQISDLHLGLLSNTKFLRRMVQTINGLQADIIVCTGDLVDMQMDHLDGIGDLMSQLRAKHGKYAVYGNHEAFAGLRSAREFFTRSGFELLSNRGINLPQLINIVGIDDPAVARAGGPPVPRAEDLLRPFANDLFTVLLKHQPTVEAAGVALVDLQLSGHVHGGQIFPFGLLTRLFYPAPYGLSALADRHWLYVSRGTGTWGPPMRVLAPAEIAVFDLRPLVDK